MVSISAPSPLWPSAVIFPGCIMQKHMWDGPGGFYGYTKGGWLLLGGFTHVWGGNSMGRSSFCVSSLHPTPAFPLAPAQLFLPGACSWFPSRTATMTWSWAKPPALWGTGLSHTHSMAPGAEGQAQGADQPQEQSSISPGHQVRQKGSPKDVSC